MTAPTVREGRDPYRRCPDYCRHDLAKGVLVSDILSPRPAPVFEAPSPVPTGWGRVYAAWREALT